MTHDDDDQIQNGPADMLAARLVLACLACRGTESGSEVSRETFGLMLDRVMDDVGDCRSCLGDVLADLAWIAAQWATAAQESDLADEIAADLDREDTG